MPHHTCLQTKGSVPALDFLYDADYAGGLPYAPFATSYHVRHET